MHFANGAPLTSADVVFSLNRLINLKGNPSFLLTGIVIKPHGKYQVTMRSKTPAGQLPASLPGEVPDPRRPPTGCRFHPRCPYAFDRCPVEEPPLMTLTHLRAAACWLQSSGSQPRPLSNLEVPQHVE